MNWFANLRIGTRLAAGFAAVTLLLLVVAAIGVTRIDAVDDSVEVILHDRFVKVHRAQVIENEVNRQSRALRTALIATEPDVREREIAKVEASMPIVAEAVKALEATIHTEKGKAALAAMMTARVEFKRHEAELVKLIRAGGIEEGRVYLVGEMLAPQTAYLHAIEAFAQTQIDGMEAFGQEAADMARSATLTMVVLAAVAALIAAATGWVLTRSITVPIAQAVQVAQTVAGGDLTSTIEVSRRDEAGQLLAALRTMNGSLANLVSQVRNSSDSIATGSSQIAVGNADLSQRTEEQAANLQQTAASMEQISATVKQSAEAARLATSLAGSASAVASQGGETMSQVVETMADIAASSRRIEDITAVIDGIAFQTNILALNAAVEAARAGEHGRGFAVVAGEVRTLAQRAATSAKEIRGLIGQSAEKVEIGSRLVGAAGGTMGEIVAQVQRVAELVTEIDTATQEQSTGIGQIGDAVTQLDQVTQQNAALVEEAAAAADSLSRQATRLTELVGTFRVA